MRRNCFNRLVLTVIVLGMATWSACEKTNTAETSAAPGSGGKIPVTTKSEEARKEFLQGRELSEKLLAQDSVQHFDKAIALDPEFATAELARAKRPHRQGILRASEQSGSLADKASDGERLLILANQAGANGDAVKQKEYLEKLVAAYPNDERAQFNLGSYSILASRTIPRPSSTTKKRRSWRQTTRPPTTFWAMPTGSRATTPTPSRPSRNTSN